MKGVELRRVNFRLTPTSKKGVLLSGLRVLPVQREGYLRRACRSSGGLGQTHTSLRSQETSHRWPCTAAAAAAQASPLQDYSTPWPPPATLACHPKSSYQNQNLLKTEMGIYGKVMCSLFHLLSKSAFNRQMLLLQNWNASFWKTRA